MMCCGCGHEPTSAANLEAGGCINEYQKDKDQARAQTVVTSDSNVTLTLHKPLYPPGRIIHVVRHHPNSNEWVYINFIVLALRISFGRSINGNPFYLTTFINLHQQALFTILLDLENSQCHNAAAYLIHSLFKYMHFFQVLISFFCQYNYYYYFFFTPNNNKSWNSYMSCVNELPPYYTWDSWLYSNFVTR